MTVWILMSGTGEYSDRQESPLRAYLVEQPAREMCERLNAIAKVYRGRTEPLRGKYNAGLWKIFGAERDLAAREIGWPEMPGDDFSCVEVELVS